MTALVSEHLAGFPHPCLRPYVARYTGYRMDGFQPAVHAGLPSRTLTVVISLDDPVDVCRMPHPRQRPDAFPTLVGGLHAAPAGIRHDGRQYGVQLEVTPAGARALFGMPAAELAHLVVSLDDLVGSRARALPDRLAAASSWSARFETLDAVLSGWLAVDDVVTARDEVVHAWSVLSGADGSVDIATVAAEVGWSRRHLGEQFRREFGLAPKVMARVMRFEKAKALMGAAPDPDLATVAAIAGYADQPHLTREWRELAGTTPAGWLRGEEFLFVQDRTEVTARS
jgi:AraC-like DNA-binding protein